jgi:hypothetical protein
MKHALTGFLLAGSTCVVLLATPAVAQVAGNPGDLHTPTIYTTESRSQAYGVEAPGFGGPLGPLGAFAAPITAPLAMMSGGAPSGGRCGITQDFTGRYTALCGL